MLISKIAVENVRSFLDRQEMPVDGPISIIVGPNGGGKTNLLDVVVTMLRRYLLATRYPEQVNRGNGVFAWQLSNNDALTNLVLEKHKSAPDKPQIIEATIEVTETDITNMRRIRDEGSEIKNALNREWLVDPWAATNAWDIGAIQPKSQITYIWRDGHFQHPSDPIAQYFLQYLQLFEFDNDCRYQLKRETLQLPMIYLPVNRSHVGFQSRVALSNFSDTAQKKQLDTMTSRQGGGNIVTLAIGRLGKRYRLMETSDNVSVKTAFYADEQLKKLSAALKDLGYTWCLETINPDTNEYDVALTKQGTKFLASAASSGERELLTYLFAIYALNVRDALVLVDEPELHLHPRWQKALLTLFERMAKETGNQFVMATHSATFISPSSIQYVSRVYIEEQKSRIIRLKATHLPNSKHLFNIINSQNNERLFFCDRVILVEGLSDRLFFEKLLRLKGAENRSEVVEIISVGGKGLFASYEKVLNACHVPYQIVADRDYIEQVGTGEIKSLFRVNAREIKNDVIENVASMDAEAMVARIEEAMASADWSDARNIWDYIKSRRRTLKSELSEAEGAQLEAFLAQKRAEGLHILSKGALEDYLPAGFRNKDIEKLINFLEKPDFWDQLPQPQRGEIEAIVQCILTEPQAPVTALPVSTAKEEPPASDAAHHT